MIDKMAAQCWLVETKVNFTFLRRESLGSAATVHCGIGLGGLSHDSGL